MLEAAAHGRWGTPPPPRRAPLAWEGTPSHIYPRVSPHPWGQLLWLPCGWGTFSLRLPKSSTFVFAFLNTAAPDAGTARPCSWSQISETTQGFRLSSAGLEVWSPCWPRLLLWPCPLVGPGKPRPLSPAASYSLLISELCSAQLQVKLGIFSLPQVLLTSHPSSGPWSPSHLAHFVSPFPGLKHSPFPESSISEVRNSFSSQLSAPAVLAFTPAPPQGLRGWNTCAIPHPIPHPCLVLKQALLQSKRNSNAFRFIYGKDKEGHCGTLPPNSKPRMLYLPAALFTRQN